MQHSHMCLYVVYLSICGKSLRLIVGENELIFIIYYKIK